MAPAAGLERSLSEFVAQYRAGGLWVGIWHPFLTGRLARWQIVEEWLAKVLLRGNVWFAPLADIAARLIRSEAEGRWPPHVEKVPAYPHPPMQDPQR